MKITLNNTHSVGLGDHLCLLSLLADVPERTEVYVNNNWNTFDRLSTYKEVLNIPDTKFVLKPTDENGSFDNTGWPLKLFSPYWAPKTVLANGSTIKVNNPDDYKRKPYIGLVCYTTNHMYMDSDRNYIEWINNVETSRGNENVFPGCKLRPVEYYARLFEYFKKNRYDVITIDSMDSNFEEKVELISKYCAAVVGYEGGMTHLCNMLGVPFFALDWCWPSPSTILNEFHCEMVHVSKHLEVLRSDEDIFKLNAVELDHQIHMVRNGYSNNRLANGYSLRFPNGIKQPFKILDEQKNLAYQTTESIFGDGEMVDFIEHYYQKRILR